MNFDYLYEIQANGQISIENIGEVCLTINDILGTEYILIIHTEYGQCKVLEYGPIFISTGEPLGNLYSSLLTFQYSEGKLITIINKFLNKPKAKITQATEISLEEAKEKIKNMVDFL